MAVELRGQSLIKHHLWKSVGIVVVSGYICKVTPNGDCPMPNPALLSTSVDIFHLSSEKQVKECGRWESRSADNTVKMQLMVLHHWTVIWSSLRWMQPWYMPVGCNVSQGHEWYLLKPFVIFNDGVSGHDPWSMGA